MAELLCSDDTLESKDLAQKHYDSGNVHEKLMSSRQSVHGWVLFLGIKSVYDTGSPSSLYEPHNEHNMASNYKGLYGIFYKIFIKVVKSENIQ